MNSVILSGNVGQAPIIRYSNSDTPICFATFSLAVKRNYKNKNGEYDTDWFNIKASGHTANYIEKYVGKGSKLIVQGKLVPEEYTDKNGIERRSVAVRADSVEFTSSSLNSNVNNNANTKTDNSFVDIPDSANSDELPFD